LGELEINFRHEDINWLVGTASGNTYARAGYYIGGNMSYELPQSGTFSMLDLESASNVDVPGLYRFFPYTHPFNNESLLSISPASVSLNEGNSGTTTFTYTVSRSGVLTGNSSVDWSLSATGDNPVNASDFFGGVLPSGSLNFAPGETTKTISVLVAGDNIVELNETFSVNLINPSSNVTIATATANGTIANDDTPPEAPILALAADTGISNNDGITNNGTVNVTGLVAGATWQYSTNGGGSWTTGTDTSFGLASGTYAIGTILVRQSDIFGNTSINGQLAAVTIDTTAPTGSLKPTAPGYAAPSTNPFGITDAGAWASPSFADIDSDGDLDLFIGNYQGNTLFYRNTAATGSTSPAYATPSINPFGLADVGDSAKPSLVDIDGDGDLDLFIGETYGNTLFYRNTAAAGSTSPAYAAASTNAFGITNVGYSARPSFADIDKDGDLDLFIGNSEGNILFYRNTAAAGATAPSYAVASVNPFGIANAGDNASPGFADIDGDGDLDLLIGNGEGKTLVYRNNAIATATTPAFGAPSTNPFGITNASSFANPSLVDIDGDGDLDLFIGIDNGNMMFSRNIAARDPVAPLISTTANGSYKIGDVISFTLQFSKAVYVTTTGGTPRLQLETGAIDRYAVYSGGSGTDTLSFSYTVQAGDSSADLDQVSSNALELNGGSIRDIAGNNAILTLAAPGAPGSLAANGALVIDGISPTVTSVVATGSGISGGSGNLKAGKVVTITVNTSERVISYGGTPSLSLNSGGIATYASGGGTNSLVFTYTVVAGENADDLRITGLNANGATISDLVGNSFVSFSNNPAGLLVIDTTMPTIIAKPDASNTVIITTNEAGTAGFYKSDNSQFLSDTVSANTNKSFTFAAQAAITSITLRATDLAENLTTSTSSFLLGTTLDDLLTGTNSDDFIYGFAGQDTLAGGGGNDILDGGVGADSLTGGTGNDQYYVDNAGDLVIEQASGGNDLVYSSIDYTLGSNVENLTLTGSASLIGTGNSLDNEITGNSGNNSLSGGGGSDTIDGGSGADTLIGGIGDDQYYVDNVNDQVIEQASAGTDLVYSSIDYTLGSNVERLVLTGSTSLNGTGNGLNNIITGNSGNNSLSGNAGNDTLNGGLGADTLTGGSGSDRFLFTTLNNSLLASFDRIMDFSIGTDVLRGPNAVTAANINKLGTVSALDSPSISSLLTNTSFLASRAATFSYADPAGFSRSFIAINDASAGFSASTDAIVEITGYTGSLNNLQIV
jgi:Ca2+-binding RTX toxin-like protein